MHRILALVALSAAAVAQVPASAPDRAYDPLRIAATAPPGLARTLTDTTRGRELPVRVYLPQGKDAAPVILLSHGLGGTRDTCAYLGEHWAARGYAVVAIQHPGSDDAVWRQAPLGRRRSSLEGAATAKNLVARVADVHAVLDGIARWNADERDACHDRFDLEHVGMSGHSFGAMTTQMVSGQSVPMFGQRGLDPRIDAALPMSPSSPRAGDLDAAFGGVAIPWLLMTGTADVSPIGEQDAESRLRVYPHLPATIDRYQLVLDGAAHSAFTARGVPGQQRNPNHHRVILATSTAFWDAYLRGDAAARSWLQQGGAKTVLEDRDVWTVALAAR